MPIKKRVVITGAAGFIGSHLAETLLDRDYTVVGIDNLLTGDTSNISHLVNRDFAFIKHDVTNYIFIDGQVDYVLRVGEIAALLVRLCHEPISEADMQKFSSDMQEREKTIVREDITAQENGQRIDQATTMTCPECGGVLPTNKSQGTVPDPAVTSNE